MGTFRTLAICGQTCGPFAFRVNAWDLDREALGFFLEKNALGSARETFAGPFVITRESVCTVMASGSFRTASRTTTGSDWTEGESTIPTLRLSNNQILGWVQIGADGNPEPPRSDKPRRPGLKRRIHPPPARPSRAPVLLRSSAVRFPTLGAVLIGTRATSLPVTSSGLRKDRRPAEATLRAPRVADQRDGAAREAFRAQQEASAEALRRYAGSPPPVNWLRRSSRGSCTAAPSPDGTDADRQRNGGGMMSPEVAKTSTPRCKEHRVD